MSTRSENGATKPKRPSARSSHRAPPGKAVARPAELAEEPSRPEVAPEPPVSSPSDAPSSKASSKAASSKAKPARASARRGAAPKRAEAAPELPPSRTEEGAKVPPSRTEEGAKLPPSRAEDRAKLPPSRAEDRAKPPEAPPVEAPAPVKRVSARRAAAPSGEPSKKRRPSARSAPPPEPKPASEKVARETEAAAPDPIYELEEKFDRLITEADSIAGDPQARRRAAEALSELAARLGGYENEPPHAEDAGLIGNARELLSTDYYARRWGRLAMRNRSEQVDDFGLDRTYEARVAPLFETLYRRWFRATVRGVSRVPREGRAMIVANHGGALPWDGPMVRTALRLEHPARRDARWLAEDFVYHMPFLGALLARVGAVRACQENAERLLEQDQVLTVFPEGMKGLGKLYRERYQLQRFGRGGYVKLALRTGTPIVPAGIAGSEEVYPLLMKSSRLAKLAGLPFLPVTPTFPWLGPLGLVPLPSRWVIVFGEPIDFSRYGPEAAQDALLVSRLNDEVRSRVQELVAEALGSRDSVF